MMVRKNWLKAVSALKRLSKNWLIFLSLLVFTSCSFGAKTVPTAQQSSPTEAASATQKPVEQEADTQEPVDPINDIQNQTENGGIVQGEFTNDQQEAAIALVNQASDAAEVYAVQGVIQSVITGAVEIEGETPEARVQDFFTKNANLYNLGQFSQNFELVNQFDQQNGAQVRQYQQIVGGIPVYQADLRVALDAEGKIALVNSNYMPESHLPQSLEPKLSPEQAKAAMQALEFEVSEEAMPSLVVYSPAMVGEGGRAFLAWLAKAGWEGGFGDVLVKDSDGSLVIKSTDIKTFTYEISDCQGEVYDTKKNILTSDEIATKPKLSGTTALDKANEKRIAPLIKNLSYLFDYYEENFGYKGYLTADSEIQILVNLIVTGHNNAFYWRDDSRSIPIQIAFPDSDLEDELDVIAHEFQHSVTEDHVILESNFQNPESSAIHEALSDFFGAVADTSDLRWQVNKAKVVYTNMADPVNGNALQSLPDHLNGFVQPKPNVKGEDEYGNGHINSTIFSHALYLMSEGGEKSGIKVHKIGIDRAAQIVFYSLARLNNNATFIQARNAMVLTCENLIEKGELSDNYCNQVRNAFAAVGIGESAGESNTPKTDLSGLQFGWQLAPNVQPSPQYIRYSDVANSGFKIVWEVFPWDKIQAAPYGELNFDFGNQGLEDWKADIRKNNLEVMATLTGAPKDQYLSDDFLAQWRDYLDHLVPEITDTVDYWQIGNQINTLAEMDKLQPGAPDSFLHLYANMLRIAYEVIKVNESSDLVLVGGLNNLAGKDVPGVDPLSFIKAVNYNCQPLCYDAINMYIDWGDLMPDQKRPQKWGQFEKDINMGDYIRMAYYDFYSPAKGNLPIWVTGPGFSVDQVNSFAQQNQIGFSEAHLDLFVRQITMQAPFASVIFYKDILNFDNQDGLSHNVFPLVHMLTGSKTYSEWPVYSTNGDRLKQAHDFRFIRENKNDVFLIWSDDPTTWQLPARFRHLTGDNNTVQRLIDYPGAGKVTEVGSNTEFKLEKGIMLLLGEVAPSTTLIVGDSLVPGYGEYSPVFSWWGGVSKFFLTYDNTKWERQGDYLASIEHPDCKIWPPQGPDGPRDQLRHETSSVLVGNTELRIERDVDINTNIATIAFYTVRDNYQFILYTGNEANEPCKSALMEILELSEPGDFGIEPKAD